MVTPEPPQVARRHDDLLHEVPFADVAEDPVLVGEAAPWLSHQFRLSPLPAAWMPA